MRNQSHKTNKSLFSFSTRLIRSWFNRLLWSRWFHRWFWCWFRRWFLRWFNCWFCSRFRRRCRTSRSRWSWTICRFCRLTWFWCIRRSTIICNTCLIVIFLRYRIWCKCIRCRPADRCWRVWRSSCT